MMSATKRIVEIELPDGSKREYPAGTTPLQVAESISRRLAKEAVVAKLDGRLVDLNRALESDGRLEIVTETAAEGVDVIRHSTAHLMAQALRRLYPGTRLAIGPTIENGFYYDVECPKALNAEDFEAIEAEMRRIVAEDLPIRREEIGKHAAAALFADMAEPFKIELIEGLEDGQITLYRQGEFVDLCRGPHVPSTGKLGAFKLRSVAGAYWRGDSKRTMLQRLYGTAFADEKALVAFLKQQEEAQKRDHRKLGRELDLFSFHEVAPGFVFWHPKGQKLYRNLEAFSRSLHDAAGYEEVSTPWIFKSELWDISGHNAHYRENMFMIPEGDEWLGNKPMNCPGHCLLYKEKPRSYRDLPIKFLEYGPLARFEPTGTLHGLLRVRGFHQDDSHLFVRADQIEEQVREVHALVERFYQVFQMPYAVKLATRPEGFMGEPETWDRAEAALAAALDALGQAYEISPGEGAFYGPKLEYHVTDAIGRSWQCATVQLDFNFPERFDLTYTAADGSQQRPVMIHRAIMGTLERFIGILVEHYAGAFPTWLAPVQAIVLPVGDDFTDYANEVAASLAARDFRVEVDERGEKIGKKIRDAQVRKIPYMLVVGGREREAGSVAVRSRSAGDLGPIPLADFGERLAAEVSERS